MLKENCGAMTEIMGAFLVLEIFVEVSRTGLFAWAAEELWIEAVSLGRMEKADRKTPQQGELQERRNDSKRTAQEESFMRHITERCLNVVELLGKHCNHKINRKLNMHIVP